MLLYTNDVEGARQEIERLGGQLRHVFTTRVLVAVVPAETELTISSPDRPAELDDISLMMAEAWRSQSLKPRSTDEPIPWDTPGFEPPC
jgi:hypothetical protein